MSNNIDQRSIDQAKAEIKRADAAVEEAEKKLRKTLAAVDTKADLAEARKRLALALRQLGK